MEKFLNDEKIYLIMKKQLSYINEQEKTQEFFKKVYLWMFLGLLVSSIVAYIVPNQFKSFSLLLFSNDWIYLFTFLAYIGFIWFLSARIMKLSYNTGIVLFFVQAILMGLLFSSIFLVFEMSSIALIFFITAVIFGLLSLFGYFTKMDLSGLGPVLFVGLIGIIIITIINIFMKNSFVDMFISIIAVLIFIGFTAYDNYMLKKIVKNENHQDTLNKLAILGALALFLDYINLFLNLLSLFGDRK